MERKVVSPMILTLVLMVGSMAGCSLQRAEAEGAYDLITCAYSLLGGASVEGAQKVRYATVAVSASSDAELGVRSGDWIIVNCTVAGAPSGTAAPTWMKVEFLSVAGINVTARVTMHLRDGTEQIDTKTVKVGDGGWTFGPFSGFVVPANLAMGDFIYIMAYGNITIVGETARIYVGAMRTVVYASFLHARARYYWDKQTGVLVEASLSSGDMTVTAKATETNLWGPRPFWMEWWFWTIMAAGIVVLAGAVYLKKRKL